MKLIPAVLAALMCGPAMADLVASRGGEVLRLDVDKPCAEQFVAEAVRDQYRAASSVIGKNHYRACWTPLKESKAALVMYEDGDYGVVPFGDLKNDPGI